MNIRQRIRALRIIAQTIPTNTPADTTTAPPATTTPPTLATISVRSLPKFNTNLFSQRPDVINDLNTIANNLNKYMQLASNNKVNFNIVYTNPSIGPSEFSNSLKHLTDLAKWLYSAMTVTRAPYTLPELRKIGTDLIAMVNSSTFPESNIATAKGELVTLATVLMNKIPR